MKDSLPRVSIGLPTYNRPELLELALECFRRQTFSEFELIISDNASPNPEVQELCKRYAREDSRFRYVRQPANQGPERNFWLVYDQARAPLFMWASDDDLWPADFLEKGVSALEANPRASAWFCQVVNINPRGDIIRLYPSFRRFQSTALKSANLIRFLWEPEIMGKANLIYSVFRREALSGLIDLFRDRPSSWGNDMNFVYGYLCRARIIVDDRVVLQKRVPLETLDQVTHPRSYIYPQEERIRYFQNYRDAAAGTNYWLLTTVTLAARSIYDYWSSGRARKDYEEWPLRSDFKSFSLSLSNWRAWTPARFVRIGGRIWGRLRSLTPASKE